MGTHHRNLKTFNVGHLRKLKKNIYKYSKLQISTFFLQNYVYISLRYMYMYLQKVTAFGAVQTENWESFGASYKYYGCLVLIGLKRHSLEKSADQPILIQTILTASILYAKPFVLICSIEKLKTRTGLV